MYFFWHIPDEKVLLMFNHQGVPNALKRQLKAPRELVEGEKIESIPFDDFDADEIKALIKKYCLFQAKEEDKKWAVLHAREIAKFNGLKFYNDGIRPIGIGEDEQCAPQPV